MSDNNTSLLDKPFWSVTWPIIIDLSLGLGLMFTDFIFLSRVSDNAAAAVGAILPIIHFTGTLYFPLAQGCSAILGQTLGAKLPTQIGDIHGITIILSLLLGAVLFIGNLLFHENMVALLGLQGALARDANQYLNIVGLSFLFIAVSKVMAGVMRSHGQTQWIMHGAIIINTINILANGLFLWYSGPADFTGVQNVALATVIASFCGMVWCIIGVSRLPYPVNYWRNQAFFADVSKRIFKIAGPASIEPMNYQVCQIALVSLIIPLGAIAITTRAYVNTTLIMIMVFELGIAIGLSAYVAHHIGAKDFTGATQRLKTYTYQAVAISGGLNIFFYVFSDIVTGFFTSDSDILALAKQLFLVGIFWGPAKAINLNIGNCLRASGDALFSSYIGASMWLVGIPLAYLFGFGLGWGLVGVWVAMTVDENLRALLHFLRWRHKTAQWIDLNSVNSMQEIKV